MDYEENDFNANGNMEFIEERPEEDDEEELANFELQEEIRQKRRDNNKRKELERIQLKKTQVHIL
jgi:hypothetical protein